MKSRTGTKLKLTSVEKLLGIPDAESQTEIDMDLIHEFKNHPFKVIDDEKMSDLVDSIRENGVLTPVLVRDMGEENYEMISGHRRMYAAKKAGFTMIPAIVREMTDDEAIVFMVESNIQREELLPSEKAFAYKMRLNAMRRQGSRTDLTSCQNGTKLRADIAISQQTGESARTIQRFIRLTELIPELLDMVDLKRLPFTTGVEISYIGKEVQQWIYGYILENGNIKQNQITILRQELERKKLTKSQVYEILQQSLSNCKQPRNIVFHENKLKEFFPSTYSITDMEKVILELLTKWHKENMD